MAELKHIMKSDPEKNGYSVNPIDDNIYKWYLNIPFLSYGNRELKLFNFDKTDPLGQDMTSLKVKHILLHVVFPQNYPCMYSFIPFLNP